MARFVKISVIGARPLACERSKIDESTISLICDYWKSKIEQVLPDGPDLIVLPELCDRPQNVSGEQLLHYYDLRKDQVINSFSKIASKQDCYIAFGTARQIQDSTWRNSIIVLDRKGKVAGVYDKNHIYLEEVKEGILCGTETPVFECDFGKVACAICFDLNFEQLRQKYIQSKPDLILFSSMFHGGLLQALWAYTCNCHFAGAISGLISQIRDPHGNVIASTTNYFDFVTARINLDCCRVHLDYNFEKLADLRNKYRHGVEISDPGLIGSVLVYSNHENITAHQMIEELSIEDMEHYLKRSLEFHYNVNKNS
jgi:hypothetical protein